MLNILNKQVKSSKITFDIIQEINPISRANNVFITGFTSNLKDNMNKKDEKNSNSVEIIETNINLLLKNKEKGKHRKQKLG